MQIIRARAPGFICGLRDPIVWHGKLQAAPQRCACVLEEVEDLPATYFWGQGLDRLSYLLGLQEGPSFEAWTLVDVVS